MMLARLGERFRQLRLEQDEPQKVLARRARIGTATLQRFEATGKINTANLTRLILALGLEEAFARFLDASATQAVPVASIAQLEASHEAKTRKRAHGLKDHLHAS